MQKLWQKHQKFMKGNAGFSLVELIIVIAIMAALVAILAPQYMKYVEKSRKQADATTAEEIFTACKVAATDEGMPSFTVTWTGSTGELVVSNGDETTHKAAKAIAANLGLTDPSSATVGTVKVKSSATTTGSKTYTVAFTAGNAASVVAGTSDTTKGWWD